MAGIGVKLEGLQEALDVLQRFNDGVPIAMSDALVEIGDDVVSEMQDTCPVDTGYLQDSIGYEISEDELSVFSEAEYSSYVEYGTWKMEPQPFFEPAIQRVQTELIDYARRHVEDLY